MVLLAGLLVLAGAVLLIGVGSRAGGSGGIGGSAAGGTGSRDPMAVLATRSPGARAPGALAQTKPRLASTARPRPAPGAAAPSQRVLPAVRSRPVASLADRPLNLSGPAFALAGLPGDLPGIGGLPPQGPGFGVPGSGCDAVPGFAGAPNLPGAANPPGSPGPPIPELATWLMMIVGLGVAGHALRRRTGQAIATSRPG